MCVKGGERVYVYKPLCCKFFLQTLQLQLKHLSQRYLCTYVCTFNSAYDKESNSPGHFKHFVPYCRWYHSNIGRKDARHILLDFNGGDGAFLVRNSERYSGKYAISVL